MQDFPKKTTDDVPRLTVSGAIPPLPPYAFMACTETTLPLLNTKSSH